jgi:hypothetical protein
MSNKALKEPNVTSEMKNVINHKIIKVAVFWEVELCSLVEVY